jgi:hypothetical protein
MFLSWSPGGPSNFKEGRRVAGGGAWIDLRRDKTMGIDAYGVWRIGSSFACLTIVFPALRHAARR